MKKELSLKFNISAAQVRRAHDAPFDNSVVDTLHGVDVSDPFRPLETFDSPETAAWVDRENKAFGEFVQPAQAVAQDTVSFLEKAVPQGLRESMPSHYGDKCGDKYIVWRKQKYDVRQSLYVKDVPDYGAPARLLLDPVKIDPSGRTDIVGTYFTRDGKTLAYTLSVSGSDERTLHFMDVETGADLGLSYPRFRFGITWDHDGQGFHYIRPVDEKTKSFEVCHHKMGTEWKDDVVVYTPTAPETRATYLRLNKNSKNTPGTHDWISVSTTDGDKNALFARPHGSTQPFCEIFPYKEGTLWPIHEINGKIYAETTLDAPNGKLVAFDPASPDSGKWETILPENPDDPLSYAFIWQNKIFASYTHDTGDVLKVYDLSGCHLHDVPVPPLSTLRMNPVRIEDQQCLMTFDNFQEKGNIYKYDSAANTLALYHASETPIDLKDCIVERLHATSKDGTKVPMTVIRNPNTILDGTAATLLYGYGGFNVSLEPEFSASVAEWVRSGGIYVQANLRGGGEYGRAWHDAGRRENKQNVFDDFAACAEHLIGNDYTSAKRLAIQGASNGGLLTLATMIQRPDLFGAVISDVPVTDMFRFHKGSYYGYGWKSDYGDPDVKEDFNVAARYSPLHNVTPGMKHPPLLIKTDIHDDRVQPWHSFKMAATLQSLEDPGSLTLLKVRTDGGHGAGMTEKQEWQDVADIRAFLRQTIGPTDQKAYKAQTSPAP